MLRKLLTLVPDVNISAIKNIAMPISENKDQTHFSLSVLRGIYHLMHSVKASMANIIIISFNVSDLLLFTAQTLPYIDLKYITYGYFSWHSAVLETF